MNILFELENIIYYIFLFVSMKLYMDIFFCKKIWRKKYIKIAIVLFLYCILSYLPNLGVLCNIVVMSLLVTIYGLCFYTGKKDKIFFHGVLWELLGGLCEYTILFIMSISYTEKMILTSAYYNMAQIFSECLLVFLTLCISRLVSYKKSNRVKSQSSVILLLLATATVIVDWGVYQIYMYPKSTSADYYAILIASIMMAMSIVIIKIYEGLGEKAELETRNTIYQRQVEAYRVQSSEKEETLKEFRRLKHDMKNHLIYMDELIRQQKNEEACKYIDKLLASRGLVYQGAVNSGNILVDGLVNYKIPYIKSLHIDFQSEVVIPSNLKMPEDNLCIIIGNLLDNAIEGTLQLQENERQIFFKFVLKKDNFFLMIENSCQENAVIRKGNCFLTTKKEKGHGMGILSVKRAVEECKGDLCIDVQKGRFQVSVILPKQTVNTRG
ncbi:sensor histidine kinase [Blautia caecimuris]